MEIKGASLTEALMFFCGSGKVLGYRMLRILRKAYGRAIDSRWVGSEGIGSV